jgi:hypothetical protein
VNRSEQIQEEVDPTSLGGSLDEVVDNETPDVELIQARS